LLLAVAVLAGACGELPAQPSGTMLACPAALLGPVTLLLDEDGVSTVGLPDGAVAVPLRWPDGYGLRPGPGGGDIVDPQGRAVARIGDRVWLGGGMTADDTAFVVCGEVMDRDPAG
jgi:hypothetical protein